MYTIENFISDTQTNPIEARNFMSFLIGYQFNHPNSSKAILAIYENTDPDWRKDKKAFSEVFLKFFRKFPIDEHNISYYKEFSPLWTPTDREEIKEKNPAVNLGEAEEYKNSHEFCKTLKLILKKSYSQTDQISYINDFINQNDKTIVKLLKKDKTTFLKNINKHNIDQELVKIYHSELDNFCTKYGLSACDFIDSAYLQKSGFNPNLQSDESILYCLQTLETNHESWKKRENSAFQNKYIYSNESTITQTFISCLFKGMYKSAEFIITKYEDHVFELMKYYSANAFADDSKIDTYTREKILTKTLEYYYNEKQSYQSIHVNIMQPTEKIENIIKVVQKFYLDKQLDNSNEPKDKKIRNKI